jgi:methyl-accepting chemotaxis protein
MTWFLNLSTRAKLFLAFGAMVVLLALMAGVAYATIRESHASQARLVEREFAILGTLKDLYANRNEMRVATLTLAVAHRPQDRETARKDIQRAAQEADTLLARLREAGRGDDGFQARLEHFQSTLTAYRQAREEEFRLLEAGRTEQALVLSLGELADRQRQLRAMAAEMEQDAEGRAQLAVQETQRRARLATTTFLALVAAALALTGFVVFYLNRIIATPLQQVARVAERIAAGDLTGEVSANGRRDEVGLLAATFQRMLQNLRQMNHEMSAGVNVLAGAAAEIMASATQLAAGSSETAASVSETMTTVEQVKQTAQVSSQKARHVSDTAQKSAQVSQNGQKAVEDTIADMQRIRDHMQAIAESIVQLSERSQAIGDIITTVNDLADQSNLLAVNAAIEAAKAGEQGRGFAVVAQEVRSLAEQSKQATGQVRTLLGDIQKATSAAVMATEQGGKSVEAGVRQSAQAGEAVRRLAESIAEAAQAATQIAASSQQQLAGMDQVVLAMENIRQASAQSVTSTAQAEASARNLNDVGQRLKQLAAQFRL